MEKKPDFTLVAGQRKKKIDAELANVENDDEIGEKVIENVLKSIKRKM